MTVSCVRVEREYGEATRQALADRDLLDQAHEIVHESGWLYIPVTDARRVPARYEVVERDPPARETQTMPADIATFEPSYERIGDIVVVDEDDPRRARELAEAIVESDIPARTVLNRDSKVKGETRVREWELLAGEGTETVHREYGCEFLVDLDAVYFSPRLATERRRVVEQASADERVLDMFAGVGPFAIPFARRGGTVVAVDVNGTAIEYLEENTRRNDVTDRVTAIHGDVRDLVPGTSDERDESEDVRDLVPGTSDERDESEGVRDLVPGTSDERDESDVDYEGWADRIVMNLPHSADEFVDTAVAFAGEECVIHYYDIQHEDNPYGPGERAIRAAAQPDYEVTVEGRRRVRSYSPHEYNVVLDVGLRCRE